MSIPFRFPRIIWTVLLLVVLTLKPGGAIVINSDCSFQYITAVNPTIQAQYEVLWPNGGNYPFLTSATKLRVDSSTDGQDDVVGNGARSVRITGLNATGHTISEVVATAGTSPGPWTSASFLRVNSVDVEEVGVYTGTNAGLITIRTQLPAATTIATIPEGKGTSLSSVFTVPKGKIARVRSFSFLSSYPIHAEVQLNLRQDVLATLSGRKPRQVLWQAVVATETQVWSNPGYALEVPELTDFWAATISQGSNIVVSFNAEVILHDKI